MHLHGCVRDKSTLLQLARVQNSIPAEMATSDMQLTQRLDQMIHASRHVACQEACMNQTASQTSRLHEALI